MSAKIKVLRNNGTHKLFQNSSLSGKDYIDIRDYILTLEEDRANLRDKEAKIKELILRLKSCLNPSGDY